MPPADSTAGIVLLFALFWLSALLLAYPLSKRNPHLKITPLFIMYRRESAFDFLRSLQGKKWFGVVLTASIAVTLLSMFLFYYFIFTISIRSLAGEESAVGIIPIVPGVTVKGAAIIYIIASIGIAAAIHELSHAAALRHVGVPIRSTGVLLAVILPAAFVEPNEEEFARRSIKEKVKVYSAGPASNFVLALLFLALITGLSAMSVGVEILQVEPGSPAEEAGLKPGFVITEVNGKPVKTIEDLHEALLPYRDIEATIVIKGVFKDGRPATFTVHKTKETKLIGIVIRQAKAIGFLPDSIYYPLVAFVTYGYLINLSLALINAAPLFITDGGRMLHDVIVLKFGGVKGKVLNFFIQILTLLMVFSSIRFVPIT